MCEVKQKGVLDNSLAYGVTNYPPRTPRTQSDDTRQPPTIAGRAGGRAARVPEAELGAAVVAGFGEHVTQHGMQLLVARVDAHAAGEQSDGVVPA